MQRISKYFIAITLLVLTSCSGKKPKVQEKDLAPIHVKFEQILPQVINDAFETVGELKADKEALVSAETAGQIEKLLVREGDWVRDGQVLIQIKADDIKADLALAKSDYEAFQKLEASGAVSKQALNQKESQYKRLLANLDNRVIRSNFAGTVGEIYVDPGDFLKTGDQIMFLVKNYPLRVSYSVPEKLIPYVKLGQSVDVELDSYPGKTFAANVDFVSPRVNPETRSLLLRAKLQSSANRYLKANQFVQVKHGIKNIPNALMVREESVYLDQGQQFLYVAAPIEQKGDYEVQPAQLYQAELRKVITGIRQKGLVEVKEGIKKGELVVYAGLQRIFPEAKLIPVDQLNK